MNARPNNGLLMLAYGFVAMSSCVISEQAELFYDDQSGQYYNDNAFSTSPPNRDDNAESASYIPGVGSCSRSRSRSTSLSYIQDPDDNCRVYVCRNGRFLLTQSVNCPLDPAAIPGPYDQFGQSQGRPCGECVGLQQQQLQQLQQLGQDSDSSQVLQLDGSPFSVSQEDQQQPQQVGLAGATFVDPLPARAIPAGFSSVVASARIPGGHVLLVGATLQQCLDACLMASNCLAVDYETASRSCSVHGTSTYCGDVTSFTTSNHYKRVPCVAFSSDSTGAAVNNQAVDIWTNYRINPLSLGSVPPACSRCRLVDCLATCYNNVRCEAVDYDSSATSCYILNSTNACSSLTPVNNAIHISTKKCPRSPSSSDSNSGGVTLYNNFVAVRFMGPTSLPANWLGYPGSRVVGGTQIGVRLSGDRCVALCQLHASCYSVDFNSVDGSCWAHTSELVKCGAPIPTNYVYHVKKAPACAFITGTYRAYPLPVTIGAAQQ